MTRGAIPQPGMNAGPTTAFGGKPNESGWSMIAAAKHLGICRPVAGWGKNPTLRNRHHVDADQFAVGS